jgi:L-malate glycosyltransferase
MRALFVTTAAGGWGGSEELWVASARDALREGHDVTVSVVDACPDRVPEKIGELENRGAEVVRRSLPGFHGYRYALRHCLEIPWRCLRPLPDVLCFSQGGTFDCCEAHYEPLFAACKTLALPYVLICQFNSEAWVPSDAVRSRAIALFSGAEDVAMVSQRQVALTERQLAVSLPNAVVVRNPVNLLPPADPDPWPTSGTLKIATVARLELLYKGQDTLFEALAMPGWRHRTWELSLFGTGPDRAYLQRLAQHYGIEDRVRFAGHVSDVRGIWKAHHLLVLPSRGEGTPLSLVEAMLCGRPAVVTDVCGNAEWVEDGLSGFVARASTVGSVNEALERAWAAQDRWPDMGAAARQRALSLYDPTPGRSLLGILVEASANRNRGSAAAPRQKGETSAEAVARSLNGCR